MAIMTRLVTAFISVTALAAGLVSSTGQASTRDDGESCPQVAPALSEREVEQQEAAEISAMEMRLIQAKREQIASQRSLALAKENATTAANVTEQKAEKASVSSASMDHNGNLCLLCAKPNPERLAGKVYKEFRTDCGGSSSPRGPLQEHLLKPVASMLERGGNGKRATNAYCELNFAKSCVDAVANQDYMYWAKSLDFTGPARETALFDARYCNRNGFLSQEMVRLSSNFTGLQAKARELCETKYDKHDIEKLSFVHMIHMMTKARYTDQNAPTLEEAELLAAWNCGMGDLGCEIAACAYSFCSTGEGAYGVYDECEGWDPVNGMAVIGAAAEK